MNEKLKKIGERLKLIEPSKTASEVSVMSRYKTSKKTFNEVVENTITEIDEKIESTMRYSDDLFYSRSFTEQQRALYSAIRKAYEVRGFKVFFVDNTRVEELGKSNIIFISWDIPADEEREFLG